MCLVQTILYSYHSASKPSVNMHIYNTFGQSHFQYINLHYTFNTCPDLVPRLFVGRKEPKSQGMRLYVPPTFTSIKVGYSW